MEVNNNLVSICIPTFNGETYIAEAMNSAVNQTYQNCEIIVSDDDSWDATLKIITGFNEKSPFPIKVFKHQPLGIGANWNHCIKNAKGNYIKFLFQDDILEPNCIEEMVQIFDKFPKVGMVASKRKFITNDKNEETDIWIEKYKNLQWQFESEDEINILGDDLFKREDFFSSPLNKIGEPSVVMFRKSIVNEIGYFNEDLEQILDYVFCYRLLKKYKIAIIKKHLVSFRIHENQATNVNRGKQIPDYELYDIILYKEFFKLLHSSQQNRLLNKYSWKKKLRNKIKRVVRKIVR